VVGAWHDSPQLLNPASPSYVVGRSIVVHDQTGARVACSNIALRRPSQPTCSFVPTGQVVPAGGTAFAVFDGVRGKN
jgi:hypothetical protein